MQMEQGEFAAKGGHKGGKAVGAKGGKKKKKEQQGDTKGGGNGKKGGNGWTSPTLDSSDDQCDHATECKGYGKGHKAGKGGTSTRKGAKGGKRGGKGWSDTSSQSELSSLRDVEDCEYMRIPDTAPKEVPAPSMNASGQCPMPQCAKRVFAETWQLEQHCFDCHRQTRAQLMATSLNHDLEIQERRECPTCKTKCGTFWQLVKHCDEAHQSTVKDLLPRVRGLLEGVTVDDVREAPLCAKARMMDKDKSHRTPRHGCEELAASVEEQLRRELQQLRHELERARETSSVHLTKLSHHNLQGELLRPNHGLEQAKEASKAERDSLLLRLKNAEAREREQTSAAQQLSREVLRLKSKLERAKETLSTHPTQLKEAEEKEKEATDERDSLLEKHAERENEHALAVQQLRRELECAQATSAAHFTQERELLQVRHELDRTRKASATHQAQLKEALKREKTAADNHAVECELSGRRCESLGCELRGLQHELGQARETSAVDKRYSQLSEQHLTRELARVRGERDRLAADLKTTSDEKAGCGSLFWRHFR